MVKQIEEFFHGAVFARNELHIVYQQQIQRMVMTLEFVKRAGAKCFHDVAHIGFGMDVANFRARVLLVNAVANGLYQMGFTQSCAAVNKIRVVHA